MTDMLSEFEGISDYVILDGRGGGTGAAPKLFRDNISVPTIPALARARRHLDRADADGVSMEQLREELDDAVEALLRR